MVGLPQATPLLTVAIVLIAGLLGGAIARRARLPGITGQILIGVLLGPVLHLIDHETVGSLRPITHFALGLIAVTVGNHLNLRRLRNAGRRLLALVLLESIITPALVLGALLLLPGRISLPLALLLAAVSIATAPATIVALVKETRSKGVFVKTLIAAVALNNIACIFAFEVARVAGRVILDAAPGAGTLDLVAAPFRQVLYSMALGGGVGIALVGATWRMIRPDHLATASILAILIASGLADALGLPPLLCCMFLGVALANITPDREELGHRVFANFENAILTVFFTLAGMELNFGYAATAGLLAGVVFAARFLGKVTAANLAMRLTHGTRSLRRFLGPALIPQAGLAIGLIIVLQEDPAFTSIAGLFLAVGLTVVTLNEIVGPILTRYALARSGELGKDRARLIGFLREDNIVTNLRAESIEEAVSKLTDILIQSNRLKVDRGRFIASILDREKDVSSCVGEGLAIPHGILESGTAIVGAMGISREGLPFPTPDGKPIHCVIVLATPPAERDRHLEVLAAFARVIGGDRMIRHQIYTAKTPAHVCELLHAEEAEDFNYFLERTD